MKNYPVQGFAAEIVQVMLGKLYRHFVSNNNYAGKAYLTNTVHDCVWVDCHRDVYKQVATDVHRILSNVRSTFNELFPELDLKVDFGVEVVAGATMANMEAVRTVIQKVMEPIQKTRYSLLSTGSTPMMAPKKTKKRRSRR